MVEALYTENPTERLYSEVLGCMLSVGRKLKVEIPVKTMSWQRRRSG